MSHATNAGAMPAKLRKCLEPRVLQLFPFFKIANLNVPNKLLIKFVNFI
jgi:hypothetical protein